MQLKTMEWAQGLRASLGAEVERLVSISPMDTETLGRILTFRTQLKQVEALVAALEAEVVQAKA